MATELATRNDHASAIEQVLISGDLKALTPEQRLSYYQRVCESVGLNPLTQPFAYLVLNGKTILYATKACTDQLRRIHGVAIIAIDSQVVDDLYVVTAHARAVDGREDTDVGVVTLGKLAGEARANAIMKAVTKAKRRVTLSICGLGMLDESEVDSIPDAVRVTEHGEVEPPQLDPEKARLLDAAQRKRDSASADSLRDRTANALNMLADKTGRPVAELVTEGAQACGITAKSSNQWTDTDRQKLVQWAAHAAAQHDGAETASEADETPAMEF